MMLKKYIDEYTIKDVPQNGVITIDIENEQGEIVEVRTGVSNLNLAFEKDEALANKNGYYKYEEDKAPEYNEETEFLTHKYIIIDNVIHKTWGIASYKEVVVENEDS